MPEPEWCTYCVNGDRKVFITSGGDCWHVTSACAGIAAGHQRNREIGRDAVDREFDLQALNAQERSL
jgi:hypothetical protein